jgi:hypothetical protein
MARFTDIEKGKRARLRAVECTTLAGVPFTLDLTILVGNEEEQAVGRAQRRAKEIGISDSENDINFQFAYDPESPDDKPVPFFDNAQQIRDNLDRERVLYLAEMQRAYQERISPRTKSLSMEQYYAAVVKLLTKEEGASEDHPFWGWPRTTQESFLLTLAREAVNSQALKSLLGSIDVTDSKSN